ncbi:hypothetical protein HMPREF9629_00421 [Peptoanaerobacter stomatis]|uniref:Uncharacterized protein n=1 Tax=Peptoanaerobacter stomatis TaxID=796937 RepID=G9X1Z8_9FIRM|nr:hypothetical protein [Peptoanaerobacter stomatis]EHL13121.1 hypothetical protein HMPREF9629_00421 [Peptoanaerobacter stomatis]
MYRAGIVKKTDPFLVLLDGDNTAKSFKRLESYAPKADDRVIAIKEGTSYIILGSVV